MVEAGNTNFAEGVRLHLSSNGFSGELPLALYDLIYQSNHTVEFIDIGGNHFRCDKTTGSWPVRKLIVIIY